MKVDLKDLIETSGGYEHRYELLAKPHMPLSAVLLRYQKQLRALGLTNPRKQLLGKGKFGVAYQIEIDGVVSVLKLTKDPYEVLSSASLQGRETKNIVPIYMLWSCGQSVPSGRRGEHWLGWFVIHRDILKPVSKTDGKLLEFIYALYQDEGDDFDLWVPKPGAAGRAMREKWKMLVYDSYSGQMASKAMMLLDAVSLGVSEMSKHGIDWADMHSDNMMRDKKGVLRIADVGFGIPRKNFEESPPEFSRASVDRYLEALKAAKLP